MGKRLRISLLLGGLAALGCGGNAVDVGHSRNRGWADAPERDASASVPQLIYESQAAVFGFALDDETLYALINHDDTFELISCPLERCRSERKVLFTGPYAGDSGLRQTPLVLSNGSLYWITADSSGKGIASCATTGCSQPRFVSTLIHGPLSADDESGVYWMDHGAASVMRIAPGADAAEPVRAFGTKLGDIVSIAARQDYVYVAEHAETISRFRKDGTGALEPIAADDMLVAFDVTAEGIYYSSQILTGTIVKCPLTGCATNGQILAEGQRWPDGIQVEGDEAFWLTNPRFSEMRTRATLSSCLLPDCASLRERVSDLPALEIVDYQQQGPRFAVSRRAIVWIEPSGGIGTSLRRLSR